MLLTTTAKVNAVKKLYRAKQYDEALEIAEKINPEKVSSVYDLSTIAEVYMKKGRYQDAKDLYLEMYGRNKTHKVMTGLIEICLKLKEPKEAEQYLREFRRMEPDNPERLVYRYRVDCMLGKEPEFLIKSLSKLKNEEYTDVWALELAKAYYKNNDREACAKECRQILQYFPDSEVAAKARVLFDACVTEEEPAPAPETPAESIDTTAMAESLMEDVSALLEENARAEAVANESLDEQSIAQATPAHSEPYLRTPEFLSLHQPAGEDRSLFGEPDLGEKALERDTVAVKEESVAASVSAAAKTVAVEEPVKIDEETQELFETVEETAQAEAAEATEFAEEVTETAAAGVAGAVDSLEALRETYVLPEELEGKIDHVFFDDDDDDDFDDEFDDQLDDEDDADEAGDDAEEADEGEDDGDDKEADADVSEDDGDDEATDDEVDDEEDDDDDDELVVVGAYGDEESESADVDDAAEATAEEEDDDTSEAADDDEADGESEDEFVADADDSPADEAGSADETAADDEGDNDAADDEFDDDELTEEDLDEFEDDLDDLETLDGADDDDFDDEFDDEDYDDLDEYDDDELDEEDSDSEDDEDLDEDDDSCDEENFPEDESDELRAEDVVFAPSDKADEELEAVAERLGNEVCNATAEGNDVEAEDESDEKKMADTQVVPCVKEKKEIPDEDMEKMLFNLLKDIGGKESK